MQEASHLSAERPLVELIGLGKAYREGEQTRTVLEDVHATIRRGELVVLLGRSGSGKTTLLNLISGIDLPTHGEVMLDGMRLRALSERDRTLLRRTQIGFIFQSFNLIPTLTVEENVLLSLELKGVTGAPARARVRDLLQEVGLAERAPSFPDRLSGGEQQRVAIARALAHDPALILADEPTGNLDYETGRRVIDLLDRLTRQAGRTMLMVTHSRETIREADRVFVLQAGRLVEQAPEEA